MLPHRHDFSDEHLYVTLRGGYSFERTTKAQRISNARTATSAIPRII